MAVTEALYERADAAGRIELHVYTHPGETASLDDAVALAEARARTLLPLLEAEGVALELVDIVPHGWMGAAERVLHSDLELEPCGDLSLWEFATDQERKERGHEDTLLFGDTESDDPVFEAELRSRCLAASERCRDARCIDSFDGLGWAEILGDLTRGQRSELAVAEPLEPDWVADIEARVAVLAVSDALGQSPHYGFHIPSVSIAAGGHEVSVRTMPLPAVARLLDSFFTAGVANGCRFDTPLDATEELEDPRNVDFAPLGP